MDDTMDTMDDTMDCRPDTMDTMDFFETEGKEYYDEFSNRNIVIAKKLNV